MTMDSLSRSLQGLVLSKASSSGQTREQLSIYRELSTTWHEIRLLKIAAGSGLEELRCTLLAKSMTLRPRYETVSYCWGNARLRGRVTVNDHILDVPLSSEEVLRAVRLPDRSRTIWIDAICINQKDQKEKAIQVANMGEVYSRGQGNIVYLGTDENGQAPAQARIANALLAKLSEAERLLSRSDRADWRRWRSCPSAWRQSGLLSPEKLESLIPLFSQDWFNRVWTFQECVLAHRNTGIWGQTQFDLNEVLNLAVLAFLTRDKTDTSSRLDTSSHLSAAGYLGLVMRGGALGESVNFGAMQFFEISRMRDAGDVRDHVFGLLGVMQRCYHWKSLPDLLKPDYNMSSHDVFRNATRMAIEQENGDDDSILEYVHPTDYSRFSGEGRSSWAVRWNDTRRVNSDLASSSSAGKREGADQASRRLVIEPAIDLGLLVVKGFLISDIAWLGKALQMAPDPSIHGLEKVLTKGDLQAATQKLLERIQLYYKDLPLTQQYAIAAAVLTKGRSRKTPTSKEEAGTALQELASYTHDQRLLRLRSVYESCKSLWATLRLLDGRPFALEDGHVGCGPSVILSGNSNTHVPTREGIRLLWKPGARIPPDKVFIMCGGRFCHILRPTPEGHYLYIGPAYVHDFMDGEVYKMNLEPQWVKIR